MLLRRPAVAGSFYPADRDKLSDSIRGCYLHPLGPGRLPPADYTTDGSVACVAPHAGYEYSGPVAAHSYLHVSSQRRPELAVIVSPNHYGVGSGVSTYLEGEWETPLGRMKVDSDTSAKIARDAGIVDFDPESHRMEHSLEVQLPFIQAIYGNSLPFVPICIAFQDMETTGLLARSIAKAVEGRRAVLVASSDLTHYEPASEASRKDMALIEAVNSMDAGSFYRTLHRLAVTACGYGAISTVMQAARLLGFRRGELLKYAHSGDTTGDKSRVVGYASIRFV